MTYNMSLRMEHNTLQTFVPISFLISFSSEGENVAIKSLTSKPIVNHANFTYNHNLAGQQFNTDDEICFSANMFLSHQSFYVIQGY